MLYNDNRPKTFDQVKGQNVAITIGKKVIQNPKSFPNLLLVGLHGSGKTSTALLFANSLNCDDQKNGNPCGVCLSCKEYENGVNYDIVEMDGASNNGVDDIRKLREEIGYPARRNKKVYIIDEAHRLSKGAFDALLKTLEETPPHVCFILCTTEVEKIPKTIKSRLMRLDFSRIPEKDITENMERIINEKSLKYELSGIKLISQLAAGSMRDALSMLEKCMRYGELSTKNISYVLGLVDIFEVQRIVEDVLCKNYAEALYTVNELYLNGKDMNQLAADILGTLRHIMVLQVTNDERLFDINVTSLMGIKIKESLCYEGINEMSNVIRNMKSSENPKMILDVGIIKLTNILSM